MIPLRDRNPTSSVPVVTLALIATNVLVFLHEASLGPALGPFLREYGLVPAQITMELHYGAGDWAGLAAPFFTSMFLHGGWLHLIGNMWFLWIFGDNVEETLGSVRYFLFYLLCGLGAGVTHWLVQPASALPTVGASGAIAGVLGAYAFLFPGARVLTLVPIFFFIQLIEVPAVLLLALWFLLQLVTGVVAPLHGAGGGIAWGAHVGGFLSGLLIVLLLHPRRVRI
jgi:membrane associated rhomboid family serine protease